MPRSQRHASQSSPRSNHYAGAHMLDLSDVAEETMNIAIPFQERYAKHAGSMSPNERSECNYIVERLHPVNIPSQHRLYKHYLQLNVRDCVWPVFWVLRHIHGKRIDRTKLPQLIQERYGTGMDLWKTDYPGPPPPRPADWPPLGEKWATRDIKNRRFTKRNVSLGPELRWGLPEASLASENLDQLASPVVYGLEQADQT